MFLPESVTWVPISLNLQVEARDDQLGMERGTQADTQFAPPTRYYVTSKIAQNIKLFLLNTENQHAL